MPSLPRSARSVPDLAGRVARAMVAVVLVGVAVSGCAAVTSPDSAFSVNGVGYSRSDFNSLVTDLIAAGQFQVAPGAKELSAADARVVMTELIRLESFNQLIAREKLTIDPALRENAESQAASDPNFSGYSARLQELLLNLTVAGLFVRDMKRPGTPATLKSDYTESPARLGVMCLSHILVASESEARTVLSELDAGADFASMAKKYSTEPGADSSGGALTNEGVACGSLGTLQESFDRDFMAGAIAAKVGVPSGPVKTQFGWHIILSRPVSEIGNDLEQVAARDPGNDMLQGFMSTADISVASAFGRWDSAVASIV